MRKKRFSIFNFDHEYIPFSVWNTGSGDLEEVNEDPESGESDEDNRNGMWSGPYRPKKGDADIRPQIWINDHPYAKPVEPILFTDKNGSSTGNFPRRDSNLLKALHRRITDKDNSISGQKKEPEINQISSTEKLGKRNGQEDVQYLDEMASIPVTGYDPGKYPETGQVQIPGKTGATPPDNFPRRENNLLKALHQRITNKGNSVSGQKADTAVIGIPSYGMIGKRVGAEALRYVEEMGSAPKSVYDPDKINTNISTASPYPYIDAPGMTPEVRDRFLKNMTPAQKDSIEKVYNQYAEDARRDLQTLNGGKIQPVKAVVFDPDTKHVGGPIRYKNDTITAKWNFLEKGENLKRSQMLHEMQHHADKNKLPIRRMIGLHGEEVYNEKTSSPALQYLGESTPVYTEKDIEENKGWQLQNEILERLTQQTTSPEDNFIYLPSNFIQAEINAINMQLEAYQRGLIPLSEKDISDIQLNLRTQQTGLKKALEYEKEKRYAPTGYPLKK